MCNLQALIRPQARIGALMSVYYIEGIRQFMRTRGSVHDARVPLAYIYTDQGNPFRKDEYLECEQEYPQKDLPSRIPRGIPLM